MADTPQKNSSKLVTTTIYSDGKKVDTRCVLISLNITKEINRVSSAKLRFLDGRMPDKDFPLSDMNYFNIGNDIRVDAGYDNVEKTIFNGIIIKHGLNSPSEDDSILEVECMDYSVKTTYGRRNKVFEEIKDSDIMQSILGKYSDLSFDIEPTSYTHKVLVQYYTTDWDFVLSQADINGMVVISDAKEIGIKKPDVNGNPVHEITFGDDIIEFRVEISAEDQPGNVTAFSWDPSQQKLVSSGDSSPSLNKQGDVTQNDLSKAIGADKVCLQAGIPLEEGMLKVWADSLLLKQGLSRYSGEIVLRGTAKVKQGCIIKIVGVGKLFEGNVYVGSVEHDISEGDWKTTAVLGLKDDYVVEKENVKSASASGLLPGIEGLQIGKVVKLDSDPDGESRIQVDIPILNGDTNSVWARLSNFYGTNQSGSFFLPEIDDEVILGFFNNDPRFPVILGSLYSSKHTPPYELEAKNNTKAIVTREKMKIEFDEEKKVITILTPGNNTVTISDDAKGIKLEDQNSNVIELNDSGISMSSPKDIKIDAKGKVSISAVSNVEIKSNATVDIKGMAVQGAADTSLTMKGNASAELSASGQTTVKGGMVMIN